jgi:DNA-binding response OmpR family regulator
LTAILIHLDIVLQVEELWPKIAGPNHELVYDVLLLDYRLGDITAMDVLKELRRAAWMCL